MAHLHIARSSPETRWNALWGKIFFRLCLLQLVLNMKFKNTDFIKAFLDVSYRVYKTLS